MIAVSIAAVALILAMVPTLLFLVNLRHYQPPPETASADPPPRISVLIPARNEESSIAGAVDAALASEGVELEVVVLDDRSEDGTADQVRQVAARDPRVRLAMAPPLPLGWCGKQHACAELARLAGHPLLAFLDADVRLAPRGLLRAAVYLESSGADLVSGIPYQRTDTLASRLLIPLIHFVLLGFLPIRRMRASRHPAYGAGCGQFFLTRRAAYDQAGGHAAIRNTLHDGIRLPRAFRAAGLRTDLVDATAIASCRMYRSAGEVWHGLAKNATEGLAAPAMIVPATALLLGGQVLPAVLASLGLAGRLPTPALVLGLLGLLTACLPRLIAVRRFRQSRLGALLHPLGVALFVAVQWYALGRQLVGYPVAWRGRAYRGTGGSRQISSRQKTAENADYLG